MATVGFFFVKITIPGNCLGEHSTQGSIAYWSTYLHTYTYIILS